MNSDSSVVSAERPPAVGGVLDVSGITVRFGGLTALEDVSLTAAASQVTGIIGPNGAGKTTLLNVLCGFVRPQSGMITFDGQALARLRPHKLARLGIARTLQGTALCAGLTVIENVMLGAASRRRPNFVSAVIAAPWADADERRLRAQAMAALDRLGVADRADEMPSTLAHGPRKRVAMARALAGEPRLLLLDEPASGLNENELPGLGELITELARQTSVVVIEHRMDLMMSICEQIYVLDFGKVIAAGTPSEVQANPAVTAAYLGESDGDSSVLDELAPAADPGLWDRAATDAALGHQPAAEAADAPPADGAGPDDDDDTQTFGKVEAGDE
jgi:branched-chain amino acid transport system ATP-binding protein